MAAGFTGDRYDAERILERIKYRAVPRFLEDDPMPRSLQIKPIEITEAHGNVTACYEVLQIDPDGQVKMVCVSRRADDGFDLRIMFQDGTSDWSISVPAGQWGPGLSTLQQKLREFHCPEFDIAEPKRTF
jgi:hypothetical protein